MNRRLLIILTVSFLVAAGCALLVYRMVGNRLTSVQKQATTPVVAAASNIKVGTVLSSADLTTIKIAGTLPEGAILKPTDAIGRGVITDLYRGEPILDNRLAPLGSGGGLAATIHPGMRALAVKVDEVVGVAGFVIPGMHVDVLVSGDPPGQFNAASGPEVRTLLQDIEVLSAGTDIQKDADGKPKQVHVVNLLVTPEQAERLSLASNHSQYQIQLALRNPLDTKVAKVEGLAMSNIFGSASVPRAGSHRSRRQPAPPVYTVVVFNGAKQTVQNFEPHEEKQ